MSNKENAYENLDRVSKEDQWLSIAIHRTKSGQLHTDIINNDLPDEAFFAVMYTIADCLEKLRSRTAGPAPLPELSPTVLFPEGLQPPVVEQNVAEEVAPVEEVPNE